MDEKELAAQLQNTKDDPSEWGDEEPDAGAVKPKRLTAMVSIRLAQQELEQVQARARQRGLSVSAYLREVALQDVKGRAAIDFCKPFGVTISTGGTYSAHVESPGILVDGRRLTTLRG
jgi:predicted DNA binding CopG/RHH family protein